MPFHVYILYSTTTDRFYVGQTDCIERRVEQHNTRKNLGAKDWKVVYSETFETRSDAVKRELEIKQKKRRTYIEFLIKGG